MNDQQLEHSAHAPKAKKYSLCFLAHDIELPGNVGSFFRIADALGVEKIFLTGKSVVPPNSKLRKASRSCENFVSFEYCSSAVSLIARLKSEGYTVIGLEISTTSVDLASLNLAPDAKVCLILGAEKTGITDEVLNLADTVVHIPMLGENSSMNVASACSIASYAITQMLSVKTLLNVSE